MKSLKHYFLVIAISLVPFVSIFSSPLAPHTHDSPVHYARMAAYYKALTEGQILPRWAGDLNYGYGMPLFNFIYHIPYLVTSAIIGLGGGLVFSFKAALLIAFALSGIFMYRFALTLFKHEGKAFVATILFQFAPFHLIDLVVRGDVAEGFASAFLPLVLYAILVERPVLIGFSTLLLIVSHNSMSLVFFGIATLFSLLFSKNKWKTLGGLGLGLALSAFYWLPAIIERRFTYGDLFMKDMYRSHFSPLIHFILPNLTNNEALQTGGIAVSLGLMQAFAFLASIVLLAAKRIRDTKEKYLAYFFIFISVGALFFMLSWSAPIWAAIPILRMFQFPWRLLNVTTLSLAILGGITLVRKKTPLAVMMSISIITILSASVYFRPPLGMDKIDEQYFWNYPLNTTYFGETDVIWSAGPAGSYPSERFEVIAGTGTVKNPVKQGTEHTFTVVAESDVTVVDKTQYFPGWRVYANGTKIPVEFQDQNWRGLITFKLPKGETRVRVVWEDSLIRVIGKAITVLSLIGVGIYMLVINKRMARSAR